MTQQALKLTLEALECLKRDFDADQFEWGVADEAITAIKEALAEPEQEPKCGAIIEVFGKDWRLEYMSLPVGKHKLYTQQYTYIAPTHQKPFGWKMVPIEPTNEMLKAMDECSTEGYDERLLAGHASSVYMAAVDVAPTPPQRTWVGLTEDEVASLCDFAYANDEEFVRNVEAKLKELNS